VQEAPSSGPDWIAIPEAVRSLVFGASSTADLFNPYSDRLPDFDLPTAPEIRRGNLHRYFSDHAKGVAVLLVAEAPGPWGCRFSGVPITSESQLLDAGFPLSGFQSSTREEPHTEYSASIFWPVVVPYYGQTFVWNTVPLHPHKPDRPLSIRTPRQSEINRFLPVLESVIAAMQPEEILAIGRKAENALQRIGRASIYVRHPSQGGARQFEAGVRRAFSELGLAPDESKGDADG
jgi:uracil-DNA glycosylase